MFKMILRSYVDSKQQYYIYSTRYGKTICVPPLCMTQTFSKLEKMGCVYKVKAYDSSSADYLLTRPEIDRLISAYNKKVISRSGIKKRLLLYCAEIPPLVCMRGLIDLLKEKRRRNQWTDKHFKSVRELVPNELWLNSQHLNISILEERCLLTEIIGVPSLPKEKSSESVAGASLYLPEDSLKDELTKLWASVLDEGHAP